MPYTGIYRDTLLRHRQQTSDAHLLPGADTSARHENASRDKALDLKDVDRKPKFDVDMPRPRPQFDLGVHIKPSRILGQPYIDGDVGQRVNFHLPPIYASCVTYNQLQPLSPHLSIHELIIDITLISSNFLIHLSAERSSAYSLLYSNSNSSI